MWFALLKNVIVQQPITLDATVNISSLSVSEKKTAQNMWCHRSLTLCGDRHARQALRNQAYEEWASSQKEAKEGMWTSCCRLTIEVQWNAQPLAQTYFSRPAILDPSKCFAAVTPWYAQHKRSVGKTGLQKNRSYINASLCGRTNFFTRV